MTELENTAQSQHDVGYERKLVLLFALGWGFLFLDRLCISYLMPTLMPALELNNAQVGYIGSITTVCFAISSAVVGALSDRSGYRKKWIIPFVFATAILSAASALSQNFTQLFIIRGLVGFAEGPIMALIYAILAPASRPSTYGRNTGLVNMGAAIIAVTLGPVVITQLVGVTTWQVAFLLAAIPSAIIGFVMIALIKETYNPPETVSGKKQNTFVEALKYRNVLMCCLIGIAGFGGYWIMMLYAPVYWTNAAGIDIQSMGFVASGMGVLAVVYSFLIPKLSDNLGRKSVLIVVYFLAFLAPLVLSTMVGTKLSIGVYLLFAGLPCAVLPLFMSIIPVESTPPELRATAGGLVIGIGEVIGGAIVPAVAGNIGDAYGLTATMLIGAACLLIAAILGFFLKETNIVVLQKREKKNAA